MTNQEQRFAIAAHCGWTDHFIGGGGGLLLPYKWYNTITNKKEMDLPDYTSDLNAMHEAEKTLQHYGFYYDKLAEVAGLPRGSITVASSVAHVRAEAFLKTIGKWKDDTEDPFSTDCHCPNNYSIEPHGQGWALYCGRCNHRHGYNIAYITQPDMEQLQVMIAKLNSTKE